MRRTAVVAIVLALFVSAEVPAGAQQIASPRSPHRWDARIIDYVRFVEDERGLDFKHPIPVRFLTNKAFNQAVSSDDHDRTKQDRRDEKALAGDLYALGLAGPKLDLFKANNELATGNVVGFYDQNTKRMTIRGKDVKSTDVKVTVVHELTHALQDQYFDITKLEDHTKSSGADTALTVLIEGDATYVEEAYIATLSKVEQDAYYGQSDTTASAPAPSTDKASDVPAALEASLSLPYDVGYWFVDFLHAQNGVKTVDAAFRRPPSSDEQVIDPVAFIGHERSIAPNAPKLEAGERKRGGSEELGAIDLYFTLAGRLSPRVALAATTGWKGDRMTRYTAHHTDCLRVAIATDNASEAAELLAALNQWAAKGPTGSATATRSGSMVTLDSCGSPDATVPTQDAMGPAELDLSVRFLTYSLAKGFDLGARDARCVGDKITTDAKLVELVTTKSFDALTHDEQATFFTRLDQYFKDCNLPLPS